MKRKVLVISHDKVGPSMAGPGIRYHQIATTLAHKHDVTLAVFNPAYIEGHSSEKYHTIDIHVHDFRKAFLAYDTIIALWLSDEMIKFAKDNGIRLIFDLYAPVPVEELVQRVFGHNTSQVSDYDYVTMLNNYAHFVRNADFTLSSNSQQRDFWLGYAFASHATTPSAQSQYDIGNRFGICPMGIDPTEYSTGTNDLLSKRIPSITKNDFVIVWTGGIWDWFDATTPISSMANVLKKNKNIKLVFLGTKHPNDDVPAMEETEIARSLATELKLINKNVFFLDGWLPYAERTGYLIRADLAIYAHKPSIEARFSHRTRVLDHILMNIPTLATRGDYLSEYLEGKGMAVCVSPLDVSDFSSKLKELVENPGQVKQMSQAIEEHKTEFTWSNTLKELVDFMDNEITAKPYQERASVRESTVLSNGFISTAKRYLPQNIKNILKRFIPHS